MKKTLLIAMMAAVLVIAVASVASAAAETKGYGPLQYNVINGDVAWEYDGTTTVADTLPAGMVNPGNVANQWEYWESNAGQGYDFVGFETSTHPQGTWNSPYTVGVDGFNYNDPQDYVEDTRSDVKPFVTSLDANSGPHGGYDTTTHKCRECHAVHRAAGKFKLTRADTRMEACDWCHGTGAGSGFNIQMDNNDDMTREYDVGHSLGFGLSSGKWKAPDDTDPAYTPKFYMGGFSCFDCHSPHANPNRTFGGQTQGDPVLASAAPGTVNNLLYKHHPGQPGAGTNSTSTNYTGQIIIANPGHEGGPAVGPLFAGGSWILLENPDANEGTADTVAGTSPSTGPINKFIINWDDPIGPNQAELGTTWKDKDVTTPGPDGIMGNGDDVVKYYSLLGLSEFCTDCHDGNGGQHVTQASMFSEDRALRSESSSYDIGYSHDSQPRH